MKTILNLTLSTLIFAAGGASAGGDSSGAIKGFANFTAGERTYRGNYAASDKSITVDIDGLNYKGNYASLAEDNARPASETMTGSWGRAFLFASSAKTLRCQLDAGFPNVSGQCQDAGGRYFQLKPGGAN